MRPARLAILAAAAAALVPATALAASQPELHAALSGKNERPTMGAPKGSATVEIKLNGATVNAINNTLVAVGNTGADLTFTNAGVAGGSQAMALQLGSTTGVFNVFGQRPAGHTVDSPEASLELYAPSKVRGGVFFEGRFTITAHT